MEARNSAVMSLKPDYGSPKFYCHELEARLVQVVPRLFSVQRGEQLDQTIVEATASVSSSSSGRASTNHSAQAEFFV